MTTPVLFLSGAGLPAWIWDDVRAMLPVESTVARYPKGRASLADAAQVVSAQLAGWPTFHLVAHSLGGTVAAAIIEHEPERVVSLTAICAVVPRPGSSFTGSLPFPQRLVLPMLMRLFGTKPPDSAIRSGVGAGLPKATTERLVNDFDPESRRLYTDRVGLGLTWPRNTAYLLTTEDDLMVPLQERFANDLGAKPTRLATGHLPMLTHPDEVARLVARAGQT